MASSKGKTSSKGGSAKSGKGAAGGGSKAGGGGSKGGGSKGGSKGASKGGSKKGGSKGGVTANVKLTLGAGAAWTGTPTTLNKGDNAQMSQTPNGWIVFAYQNTSTTANDGTLVVSSGAGFSQQLPVPALTNQPLILLQNFGGNNLGVLNFSSTAVPILIEAVGAGLPGLTPTALKMDGTSLSLVPFGTGTATTFAAGQGNAPGKSQVAAMLQATSGQQTMFAIQVGNTSPMVILLNADQNAGPGTSSPKDSPPAGYYATTSNNTYQNIFKGWGSSVVFIVNMSASVTSAGTVSITGL